MTKKIITIGASLPYDEIEFVPLYSQNSLLDYDISVFSPDISLFISYHQDYLGKPCLNDTDSFRLKEHISHWRREILEAVRAGKTVFIFLTELQEIYVATGEKSFSGTGRNRQTTRHVTIYSNYELIPGGIDVVNSKGTSMKLYGSDNPLSAYWADLESVSEFRVFISGEGVRPLVVTKAGDKTVSAYLKYKDAHGTLILLPYINFNREGFTRMKRAGNEYWTDKANAIGKNFISAIVGLDNTLREGREITPPPYWVTQDRFALDSEQNISNKLLALENKFDTIQKEKENLQQALSIETEIKALLYEKGAPLEAAILKSLKILGFKCSRYHEGDSEFDVVFESSEGRLIGEAEGKDNKAINIDKLRQLEMNIHEDYSREEVTDISKGVLIGNAFRFLPPDERNDFFTDKCKTSAKRSNTALIKSTDLFLVVKYLSSKSDKAFAKRCRNAILKTVGLVTFPPVPQAETPTQQQYVLKPDK